MNNGQSLEIMKHPVVLRLLTIIIFLITWGMPLKEVNSCGFYAFPEDFRFWLFQPQLANIATLQHFTLTSNGYYTPDGEAFYGSDLKDTVYYQENITEWFAALGGEPSQNDIRTVLYHLEPAVFFEQYPQELKNNSFIRVLQKPQYKELLDYLLFAKKCEQVMNVDPWAEEETLGEDLTQVLEQGNQLYAGAGNAFVRLRTAYQRLKLNHYLENSAACNQIYDEEIAPVKTNSWIKSSALFYKAVAVAGDESYYLLTRVFDESHDKRLRSVMLLHEDPEVWERILPLTRNNHDKAVLHTMQEIRNPGRSLEKMKEIYQLEPAYPDFKILLEREINKLEDWVMTPALTEYQPALDFFAWYDEDADARNWENDMAYLKEVRDFVVQLLREGKQPDKAFLLVSAAWLSFLNNDYIIASAYLEEARKLANIPANVGLQLRLTDLLNETLRTGKISAKAEQAILDFFIYLDARKSEVPQYKVFRSQVALLLAEKFIEKGEVAKGILLHAHSTRDFGGFDYIGSTKTPYHRLLETAMPADYDRLLAILDKKDKSPFEIYLLKNPVFYRYTDWRLDEATEEWVEYDRNEGATWDINLIKDYKAMWYVNRNKLDSAYAILRTVPDTFWQQEPYQSMMNCNPFFVDFYRPHQFVAADTAVYNKTSLLRRVLDLQQEAEKNPARRAQNYFLLANAYYNMTWRGNVWLMNRVWWSGGEDYYVFDPDKEEPLTPFEENYYGATIAKSYYLKALEETKDKKLASLCLFMAGKCEDQYNAAVAQRKGEADQYVSGRNPYLGLYKSRFRDMSTYLEMTRSCSVYQDFIGRY